MINQKLLSECKKGLNIQAGETGFDGILTQKMLAVKSFMKAAGVSDAAMEDDLAVGVIVMGVADLWNVQGGEIKFSPVFYTMLGQLAAGSSVLTMSSNPADGATGVSIDVKPALTFGSEIGGYSIKLVEYESQEAVIITTSQDITKKVITITPGSNLAASTKYAVVVEEAVASNGPSLKRTVISFTTT